MNCRLLTHSLLIANLLVASTALAEVYKTVDKQGRVTYTDTPPANSAPKAVELPKVNTMPGVENGASTPSTPAKATAETEYSISLTSPANGTTLMPEERSVTLSAAPAPALAEGMQLGYYIDGQLIEKTDQLSITLSEPPRGEHKLSVAILDAEGQPLAQSDAITLVVMRPILKQKPVKGQSN